MIPLLLAISTRNQQITLPLEMMGAVATSCSVSVNLKGGENTLTMRIHGVETTSEASVEVNKGIVIPISNKTAAIVGPGYSGKFGGIGGPVTCFDIQIKLPVSDIPKSGSNRITFFYNGTNGINSGWRVLGFNFLNSAGAPELPSSDFVQSNPSTWKPPLADSSLAGKLVFQTAPLGFSPLTHLKMSVHCMDCHAQDGRDLSYFNYSNYAIESRCEFHGLSVKQGEEVASYIRSLPYASKYGRPWNPPYQPGQGLDKLGEYQWAAGADIDAVLPDDAAMNKYLFPNGMNISVHNRMNIHEMPLAWPLLDWNHWLPTIAPQDADASFETTHMYQAYIMQRANLIKNKNNELAYLESPEYKKLSGVMISNKFGLIPGLTSPQEYSFGQWRAVKKWEMQEEFGLDSVEPKLHLYRGALPQNVHADEFGGGFAFANSPFRMGIQNKTETAVTGNILGDGYLSSEWYYMQLILFPGDGISPGFTIIDWGYMPTPYMWMAFRGKFQFANQLAEETMISMQQHDMPTLNTNTSGQTHNNWHPWWAGGPGTLLYNLPRMLPEAGEPQLLNSITSAWLAKNQEFTATQWGQASLIIDVHGKSIPINPVADVLSKKWFGNSILQMQVNNWYKSIQTEIVSK